ncbi:ATP-dependent sacrificial sulfur transferase LarE [Treponema primitia]|uniref:ATP-dependent sacrificial sulfur transferase LarE n=1 Tax=Treponema primitia TaxID=88058 RepID=UPI00398004CA
MPTPEQTLDKKYRDLLAMIAEKASVAVAFSGGVDSSFLCHAAAAALGSKAIAITVVSPMLPKSEIDCAAMVARKVEIEHILIEESEIDAEVAENSKERCYFCKKIEFSNILDEAKKRGINTVLDGSNMDDLGDYRPGLKALEELQIFSPLRAAGLTKQDIRDLSKRFDLPTWDKPAFACLASRIPYGERIDREKLSRVEKAEDYLREAGFRQFRVRSHGDIARIEVSPEERRRFFDENLLDSISKSLKSYGFLYVSLELEGYVMGNLNRAIPKAGALA